MIPCNVFIQQEFTCAVKLAKLRFDLGPFSEAERMVQRVVELAKQDSQNRGVSL